MEHRTVTRRLVYENRWTKLWEDRTERADGAPGLYAWIDKPPSALIVPIEGDEVWLVEQFRHPVGARFWEFAQGAWEEAPGADGEALARKELGEETGLRAGRFARAEVDRMVFDGEIRDAASVAAWHLACRR